MGDAPQKDEERQSRTITARAEELGFDMTRKQAWLVGERCSERWYKIYHSEPYKPLVPKRFGNGTHHIAIYPPSFFGEMDRIIRVVCGSDSQKMLFVQTDKDN